MKKKRFQNENKKNENEGATKEYFDNLYRLRVVEFSFWTNF